MTLVYVALGGAIGSTARYLLGAGIARLTAPASPLSTFTVNLVGCFAFGIIAGLAERHVVLTPAARAFLLVGVLGGFTTFSAYTYETYELLRQGRAALALANSAGQVVVGFAALVAGMVVVRGL